MDPKNLPEKRVFPPLRPIRSLHLILCPDCNVLMRPYSCKNIIIDQCPKCLGLWFDHRELGVFRNAMSEYDLRDLESVAREEAPPAPSISGCPRCQVVLIESTYAYNTKVTLRKCPSCGGIWLPFVDTVRMVELERLSQEIMPHVRGIAEESKKIESEMQQYRRAKETFGSLRESPSWGSLGFVGIILPLGDDHRRSSAPIATLLFAFMSLTTFIALSVAPIPRMELYEQYGLIPFRVSQANSLFTLWTSMFMHSGFLHLASNLFFLWLFGRSVEDRLGFARYLALYVACGISASIAHVLIDPMSTIPTVGASGAISGLMGAYLVLFPQMWIKTFAFGVVIDIPAWLYLIGWFLFQLAWGISSMGTYTGIATWAHIGGFAAGILAISLGWSFGWVKKSHPAFE